MKSISTQILYFLRQRPSQISLVSFLRFLALLSLIITIYSVIFHFIMESEGKSYSWVTGFYWTLTVMSTLGFGDITFQSDLGRFFTIIVMLSGVVFLLILFPFTFIEFFYAPWLKAQAEARTPRELPMGTRGHVILTHFDPVTTALIRRLQQRQLPYVLLVAEMDDATELHYQGFRVVVGDLDMPETYRRARVENALLVATTADDRLNANVASTVREVSETVPLLATADSRASVDILELAGCNHVVQIAEQMGRALSRRTLGSGTLVQTLGSVEGVLVAEGLITGTRLVGQRLDESGLREQMGLSVLGTWERGRFAVAYPEMLLTEGMVLVLAGSEAQLGRYNEIADDIPDPSHPVVIVGGGRVGRATARALARRGVDYRIIDRLPERIRDEEHYVLGDAADIEVLGRAGIADAPSIIITTHDDDTNIYLTIYCRRLRPGAQIISRAVRERNVATLHRAGANFVMSYASLGATAIINVLDRNSVLAFAEGLDIFGRPIPASLVGKSLIEANVRAATGCSIVGVRAGGPMEVNPDPTRPLPPNGELLIVGTPECAQRFRDVYGQ